jgi:hypothetical protein
VASTTQVANLNAATAGTASAVAVGGITGLGTGVATALAINVGSAGAPVVLNGALGSPSTVGTLPAFTAGADIIGSDHKITASNLIDCGYTVVDIGNISNATVTFDYTAGSVQTFTSTGSTVTWAFSNWPPTGNLGEILVIATNAGAYTQSISGITWIKPDGTTTTTFATYLAANTGRTALQTSGVDQILFWSRDAGTTIYGKLI